MTRRTAATALVALSCLSLASFNPAPAADKPEEVWISLFDGKTLKGWESVHVGGPPAKFEVVDGVIEGSGGQAMLYSEKGDYKNFKFRAEVKINDHGNSGMYVRSAKKPSFLDGHEIQINATHSDYIKTGSLYTLVHLLKSPVPPTPSSPRRSKLLI